MKDEIKKSANYVSMLYDDYTSIFYSICEEVRNIYLEHGNPDYKDNIKVNENRILAIRDYLLNNGYLEGNAIDIWLNKCSDMLTWRRRVINPDLLIHYFSSLAVIVALFINVANDNTARLPIFIASLILETISLALFVISKVSTKYTHPALDKYRKGDADYAFYSCFQDDLMHIKYMNSLEPNKLNEMTAAIHPKKKNVIITDKTEF